ncbi:MAG: membrane integrity-associated transporter subunit PqiC [Candidatus Competibacteraceae bacterium]|nr:MAG: membrane integrity-associated transporter subunit PqiC [Candidatus Competibacteraceae bacterium]
MLLTALALSACLLPQDKSPPRQDYLLEVAAFAPPPIQRTGNKILLVAVPRAAPGFDSNRIAYSREPLKLDYYNDSGWSDTPAKMLLPILVRAFETTGVFKAVVSPPAPGLADLRVDVDLIRLQQEFMTQPSTVRLTARIKVLDMKSRHVLGTQVFEAVEPAPSENAHGAVQATNAAVRKILGEMVPFALQYVG